MPRNSVEGTPRPFCLTSLQHFFEVSSTSRQSAFLLNRCRKVVSTLIGQKMNQQPLSLLNQQKEE